MLNFRVAGLVLIILSVRPTAGQAQSLHWKSISGVSGSSMLRKGADNKLFVVSGVSSLFDNPVLSSTDGGVTWAATPLATGQALDFAVNGQKLVVNRFVGFQ